MKIDLLQSCNNDQERSRVLRIQHGAAQALRVWAADNVMNHPVQSVKLLGDKIVMTMLDTGAIYELEMRKVK